jgi:hypothetical protein
VGADEAVKVAATVVEERPSAIYLVKLENQQQVLAHLVGAVKFCKVGTGRQGRGGVGASRSDAWQDHAEDSVERWSEGRS